MKLLKLNQKGITHLLAPIAFVALFAVIGGVVVLRGHAASKPLWGTVYRHRDDATGVKGAHVILRNITDKNSVAVINATTNSQGGYFLYPFIVSQTYRVKAYKTIDGVKHCSTMITFKSTALDGGNQIPTLYLTKKGSDC